jgi:DNA-binding beta-propeller fold protein YncE
MLRLLDTNNGALVPGHEMNLRSVGLYTYLPGQQSIAILDYPSPNGPQNPGLVLLDISAWSARSLPLTLDGWAQVMAVSGDGARIAIAGYGDGTNLTIVDALKGAVTATGAVPNQVRALGFTQDGSGLLVYVSNEEPRQGLSQGAPQAMLLNADDLSIVWQTELAGVRDGFFPGPDYQGQAHEPGAGDRYLPGVAFSPVADTLYVVHADEDRLTSVDFSSRSVAALDIRPPLSFVERILSLGARVAHAKVQSGTEKHVAISPDGGSLYVTGIDNQFTTRDNGEWDLHQEPLGLKVIDAATGTELQDLDTQADQVAVLPDGLVLLRTWIGSLPSSEVYDPAAQRIVSRYSGVYQNCVPLTKGGYVLAPSAQDRLRSVQVYNPGSEQVLESWEPEDDTWAWVFCSP